MYREKGVPGKCDDVARWKYPRGTAGVVVVARNGREGSMEAEVGAAGVARREAQHERCSCRGMRREGSNGIPWRYHQGSDF